MKANHVNQSQVNWKPGDAALTHILNTLGFKRGNTCGVNIYYYIPLEWSSMSTGPPLL